MNEIHAKNLHRLLKGSTVIRCGVEEENNRIVIEFDKCVLVIGDGESFEVLKKDAVKLLREA